MIVAAALQPPSAMKAQSFAVGEAGFAESLLHVTDGA